MLAEGDVDPAAGSRDEPTRLPVEAPSEGRRYKYTRVLFLESNKGVPPLTPTFCLYPPLPTLRQSFFVLAHEDAQRVQTRGPNPNPTTQAQSKRCLPLSTKSKNMMKILFAGLPNPMFFETLF